MNLEKRGWGHNGFGDWLALDGSVKNEGITPHDLLGTAQTRADHDREPVRVDLGAPVLVLHGSAAVRARAAGVVGWHLSLTHTDRVAMALVVAEGAPAAAEGLSTGPLLKP